MQNFRKQVTTCSRCVCVSVLVLTLTALLLTSIVNFIMVLVLFDNSLGNKPSKMREGYLDENFYRIEKNNTCEVVRNNCKPIPNVQKDKLCHAVLKYPTDAGSMTSITFGSFLESTKYGKYAEGSSVPCYYDPFRPDLVDYRVLTNSRVKLLTWAGSLYGGVLGALLFELLCIIGLTLCWCGRKHQIKRRETAELDKLINSLDEHTEDAEVDNADEDL